MGTPLNMRLDVFTPWEAANAWCYPVPPEGVTADDWSRARMSAMLQAWPQGNNCAIALIDEWACRMALYLHNPNDVVTDWQSSCGRDMMRVSPFPRVYDLVDAVRTSSVSMLMNVGRDCANKLAAFSAANPPATSVNTQSAPNTAMQNIGESIAETGPVRAVGLSSAVSEVFGVNASSPTAPRPAKGLPWYVIAGIVAGGAAIVATIFGGHRR